MESISPAELAVELLNHCLRGSQWPQDVLRALTDEALDEDERLAAPATRALFSILVERLADLFEPALCDTYAALFSTVIEQALPELRATELLQRYRQVRTVRPVTSTPDDIFVPSRVTLGADVAVTSIVLDAARRRFPKARLWFVGPKKAWELFERSPDVCHLPVAYGRRGLLADRLAVYHELRQALAQPNSLVLDPDSRLTQLGLLPVCPPENHHLFESRSYGGDSLSSLPELTRQWVRETLGVDDAQPWLHPKFEYDFSAQRVTTVSLGVGENPAKRIEDPFESELLQLLAARPGLVMVDAGAPGSEEEQRVRQAIESTGLSADRIGLHQGSFASFAAMIAASELYAGYDSAGQHVAAALGIPLITVFAGYASDRMFARWRPDSPGPTTVIQAGSKRPAELLASVRAALPS
ncbi:glycosyltransferase family 9 protein [uncultured Paludibaculum sp.]|uniref:glycosyltransferase family 9 protein n=1 Tax=uncultured Paludibaculum sp. TaxID=1765020 RepID=UPI002AAAB8EB|nr:glycosyltransferase family 9 protein [uncultured Paludibaculum sp.]